MKDLRVLLRAMEHRAVKLVVETAKSIQTQVRQPKKILSNLFLNIIFNV